MATPGKVDYHIHYFMDACAHKEMILPNIEIEAARIGLDEICVLKHYSERLPNKQEKWVWWKRVVPEQVIRYLSDLRSFRSSRGMRILAGVETEILDDSGRINVPESVMDELDIVNLCVHWLPDMEVLQADPRLYPHVGNLGRDYPEVAFYWRKQIKDIETEVIVENFVKAYVLAIEHNSKIRVLGHMSDGLNLLRQYEFMVDALNESKLIELMEPLMKACAKRHVLWELDTEPVKYDFILRRANEIGVWFSATADAHRLTGEGVKLQDHAKAEAYIDSLGLKKGVLCIQ